MLLITRNSFGEILQLWHKIWIFFTKYLLRRALISRFSLSVISFLTRRLLLCRVPSIVVPRFISLNWIRDFKWDWKVSHEILFCDTREGLHCSSYGFQKTVGSQIEKTFQGLDQRGLIGQWVNLIHSVIPTCLTSTKASSLGEAHE